MASMAKGDGLVLHALNEYDRDEWRDIVGEIRPDITPEQFADMWLRFEATKKAKALQ